jgi:hypothetical protein
MKHILPILLLFLFSKSLSAQKFQMSYTFDSVKTTTGTVDPTPVLSPAGTRFGSFSAKGISANPNASNRFSFTGWGTGAVNGATLYASLTGILDTGRYYEVSVSPLAGYQLELDSVSFYMQRSGTGVRTFSMRSSIDQYMANLPVLLLAPDTVLTVETGNIVFLTKDLTNFPTRCTLQLGGKTFTALGKSVTFRFYGFNSESGAGTFSMDAVNFYGSSGLATGIRASTDSGLSVFPIPSDNGLFYLNNPSGAKGFPEGAGIRIYSMQGQLILQTTVNGAGHQELNLETEADGVYFLVMTDGVNTATRRISICRSGTSGF